MEVEGGSLGLGFPFWVAVRRKFKIDDLFFAAGNIERELLAKHVALDLTEDDRYEIQKMEDADRIIFCPIGGCGAHLNSLEDFEDHYHARHRASCSVCSRVYPTSRLLSIHVSEAHDSFFQAKVARGFPMYECLVEGCGVKLKSYKSRQQHLVDKHKFPTSFEFFKKAQPSQRQRHKAQRKQYGAWRDDKKESSMDVHEKAPKHRSQKCRTKKVDQNVEAKETRMEDDEEVQELVVPKKVGHTEQEGNETGMEIDGKVEELVSAVSKLSTSDFTPRSVSFGRGFSFVPRSARQKAMQAPQPDA